MQGCPVAALARASLSLSSLCITSGHSSAQHIALSCDWALRSASSTHASLLAAGAASNAPLASTPSPGHCCIQLRSKVYTSNAMDEERSRRIAGNFAFHKARKAWKQKMGVLKMQWLADINQSKAGEVLQDVRQHAKATVAREAQHRAVSHAAQQHTLAEQIQRAELDVEVARVRLARARRLDRQKELQEKALDLRRRALLAASSSWIREHELTERINQALDNPQPFGFVRSIPVEHGY